MTFRVEGWKARLQWEPMSRQDSAQRSQLGTVLLTHYRLLCWHRPTKVAIVTACNLSTNQSQHHGQEYLTGHVLAAKEISVPFSFHSRKRGPACHGSWQSYKRGNLCHHWPTNHPKLTRKISRKSGNFKGPEPL